MAFRPSEQMSLAVPRRVVNALERGLSGEPHRRGDISTSWVGDAAILALSTAGTYASIALDRPRTAVLVYLLGVLFVGARSGLRRGIAAALIASFVYNFALSEPVFRFGVTSFDQLVPLLAFNISAIVSGGLAGRLNDRARAARAAEAKNALLLELSDELQRAISADDVAALARVSLAGHGIDDLAIFLRHEGQLAPLAGRSARELAAAGGTANRDCRIFDLSGAHGKLGVASFSVREDWRDNLALSDLQAVANLLALTIDRCLLLEQLSESRAAKRSEELKSALLSSVSHDLRTPLTAIEAAASSLRAYRSSLSAAQQDEMLATISEQCTKLNRYTANLLDMGRIQAGISSSQLAEVDLVEILGVALASVRKRFPQQEICKEAQVPAAAVSANPAMLEQVIVNLLENAILHGGGSKPILIRLTLGGATCVLEISDHGPGIAPAEQQRVFERFYRGGDGTSREGSGLGLHIAKGFVEAFGGTITITSPVVENRGTTVTVSLPLVRNTAAVPEAVDAYLDR